MALGAAAPGTAADVSIVFTMAPANGAELRGVVHISAEASAPTSLRRFALGIEPDDPGIRERQPGEEIAHGPWKPADLRSQDAIRATWDTRGEPPIFNGVYTLTATAETQEGIVRHLSVRNLRVNNAPGKPTRPEAVIYEGIKVKVTFHNNPEPDVRRYVMERSEDNDPFRLMGPAHECLTMDLNPPVESRLRYRIVAIRDSPVSVAGIPSVPSDPTDTLVIRYTASQIPPAPLVCPAVVIAGKSFFENTDTRRTAPPASAKASPSSGGSVAPSRVPDTFPASPISPGRPPPPGSTARAVPGQQPPGVTPAPSPDAAGASATPDASPTSAGSAKTVAQSKRSSGPGWAVAGIGLAAVITAFAAWCIHRMRRT